MEKNKPFSCELLAPAGSLEKLKTAVSYGADAVYLGGREFSLRAHAANFSPADLEEGIAFAHERRVRVFVTVNIFAHNRDLDKLAVYMKELARLGADGLIISDPGVLRIARRVAPHLSIHLSTQANVTNVESGLFWQEQGVSRLNLARELSLAEIRQIRAGISAKIEVFVHGALCISYSGRCMLSLYLTGRDANQGNCAHPCRYGYRLQEEKRPGQFFPVEEDERGMYIFNSKDLCLLKRLPELVRAGVDSIKIEGRMKGIYYAGGIVRIYRAALDYILQAMNNDPEGEIVMPPVFMEEMGKLGSRGYTENFFDAPPEKDDMCYSGAVVDQTYVPAGIVLKSGARALIEVRHRLMPGETLEYMGEGLKNISFQVLALENLEGRQLEQANPGSRVILTPDQEMELKPFTLIRRIQKNTA
ncbi:MAG: U32 family peptidase [Pseudomonadota bacterium]